MATTATILQAGGHRFDPRLAPYLKRLQANGFLGDVSLDKPSLSRARAVPLAASFGYCLAIRWGSGQGGATPPLGGLFSGFGRGEDGLPNQLATGGNGKCSPRPAQPSSP